MASLRTWRSVRHLGLGQIVWRGICRARFVAMGAFPTWTRRWLERSANALPPPRFADPRFARVAEQVLRMQQALHGCEAPAMLAGRFRLLGREVDFGSLEAVEWRRDLHEGNNALWRMTLGYFGYAPPLLVGGDEAALRAMAVLVRSLEAQNPLTASGVFRDIWNPYCVSCRVVNLLAGLWLFGRAAPDGAGRARAAREDVLRHVRVCAAFLRANLERDMGYNHLLKNYVALAIYAAAAGTLPKGWRFLRVAVPASVAAQILDDGGHAERSPMYHVLSMLDVQLLADSGVLSANVVAQLQARLQDMRAALRAMAHPDGDIALFNDSWLGGAPCAAALLDGGLARAGDHAVTALDATGYVQLRSEDAVAIFDCGACGPDDNPAHAHADFLALELSIAKRRFLVDFGVPTYTAGVLRDRSRSARTHNGPRFEAAEPMEFWLSFRVGRRGRAFRLSGVGAGANTPLRCAGWQNGYAGIGGAVARCVALFPGRGLLIVDVWQGGAKHEAVADYLIAEPWQPVAPSRFACAAEASAPEVAFDVLVGEAERPAPAEYWPRFGQASKAHRVRVRPKGADTRRWATVWLGWKGSPPEASVVRDIGESLFAALPTRKAD